MIFLTERSKANRGKRCRTFTLLDDREYCVVPNCGVRSRVLDRHGMCPTHLWDLKHDRYYQALMMPGTRRRRSA